MSILKSYIGSLREIASMPPERAAVQSTARLSENMGRAVGNDTANAINRDTSRMQSNYEVKTQKQDIASANTDAAIAAGVGVANVGLQGLTAWDRMVMAEHEKEMARVQAERDDMLLNELSEYNDYYSGLLNPTK